MDPFATERKAFEAMKPQLLAKHPGWYAAFAEGRYLGSWKGELEAVRHAYQETGGERRFFVERVQEEQPALVLPAWVRCPES